MMIRPKVSMLDNPVNVGVFCETNSETWCCDMASANPYVQ